MLTLDMLTFIVLIMDGASGLKVNPLLHESLIILAVEAFQDLKFKLLFFLNLI